MSCGVLELSGLTGDQNKVLFALAAHLYHPARGAPAAFVCWSDTKDSNGEQLAQALREKFEVSWPWVSVGEENPKTSNTIFVWVWRIPHKTFKEWYIQQRVERAKKL